VAEKLEHTIRRTSQEKGLVILVDVANLVDLRSHGVPIGELVESFMILPIPDPEREKEELMGINKALSLC
jgi:hypothetical protein